MANRRLVLDVSHCDRGIDLARWRDRHGVWGVIVKCGGYEVLEEGGYPVQYRHRDYDTHYANAKAAGLHVGVYYYSIATDVAAARRNADHCASLLKGRDLDLPVYLDVEDKGQLRIGRRALTDVVAAFCDRMRELGHLAGVYTYRSMFHGYMRPTELLRYPLWLAEYSDRCRTEYPHGMWQFGCMRLSDGDVSWDDVAGYVDANWLYTDYTTQNKGANMTKREAVLAKVRSQLGVRYYSMHEGPRGSAVEGWGCAMLCAWCYDQVLGTAYYGSCYNFAGDALGQSVNHGGGQWRFVDDPLPGDLVIYIAEGYNGLDYDDYGHIAMYVGDGKVIGAWGVGKPGQAGYKPLLGVAETTIAYQSLGNGWRFLRNTRIDEPDPEPEPEPKPEPKPKQKVPKAAKGGVYRLYDGSTGDHFFTTGRGEAQAAADATYTYEQVAWTAPDKGDAVYRLYDPKTGEHIYTRNAVERGSLKAHKWRDEGVAFRSGGKVPVYRLFHERGDGPSVGKHIFTKDKAERSALLKSGWKDEGVAFYATK